MPCGGTISRITIRSHFATAVFALGVRKGHTCDGLGIEAAERFEVVKGKLRSWTQVAVRDQAGAIV